MSENGENAQNETWSTITTLKETLEDTLEFVAYHLVLGAKEVFLYFDDPLDEAIAIVSEHPRVIAIACDEDYWQGEENRPAKHQARQKLNARDAYKKTKADWVIHLDVDEFVDSDVSLPLLLSKAKLDVLRLAPYEHLFYSKSGRNGGATHIFRGAMPDTKQGNRISAKIYGRYHSCLNQGMLGHTAGKHFVRTNIEDMILSIHGPFLDKHGRAPMETAEDARLLHLHSGDYDKWSSHVKRRLESGAYMARNQRRIAKEHGEEVTLAHVLTALIEENGEDGVKEFYNAVCVFSPQLRPLRRVGQLYKTNLWLSEKQKDVFGGAQHFRKLSHFGCNNLLEGEVEFRGVRMRVAPDNNYTECRLARDEPAEDTELDLVMDIVKDRKVLFYDVGANAGIYSLAVANNSLKSSQIIAFEPNPEMLRRLNRNIQLNQFNNICVRPVALGDRNGFAFLNGTSSGNLGQASIGTHEGSGLKVEMRTLEEELLKKDQFEVSFMKIDVEGFEPAVLRPVLTSQKCSDLLPDFILIESIHSAEWEFDLLGLLHSSGYSTHSQTRHNTLLQHR